MENNKDDEIKVIEIINTFKNESKDVEQERLMNGITTDILMEVLKHDKFEEIKDVFKRLLRENDDKITSIFKGIGTEFIKSSKYIENNNYKALNSIFDWLDSLDLKLDLDHIYGTGLYTFDRLLQNEIERLEKDKNAQSVIGKSAWHMYFYNKTVDQISQYVNDVSNAYKDPKYFDAWIRLIITIDENVNPDVMKYFFEKIKDAYKDILTLEIVSSDTFIGMINDIEPNEMVNIMNRVDINDENQVESMIKLN